MTVKNLISMSVEEQETLVATGNILGAIREFSSKQETETVYDETADRLIHALYEVIYSLIPHKAN